MKKTLFFFSILILVLLLQACSDENETIVFENPSLPTVTIEQVGESGETEVTLKFLLSEQSAGFYYAVGGTDDREAFKEGTLSSIQQVKENGTKEIVIDGLQPDSVYTVFARAYDAENQKGPLAEMGFITLDKDLQAHPVRAKVQYITCTSVAFTVHPENYYYKFEYALGKAGDKEAFEKGTLGEIVTQEQMDKFTVSYFDISPATDYVWFLRAYNRADKRSQTFEAPFTAAAAGSVPEISMHIDNINIYEGSYTFIPNAYCKRFGVMVCKKGDYDSKFYNKYTCNGDILLKMDEFVNLPFGSPLTMAEGSNTAKIQYFTPQFKLDAELEAWAILYDQGDKAFGVQRMEMKTPAYDNSLGEAAVVTFQFDSVAAYYSPFRLTVNEHTLLTYYAVWEVAEFEKAKEMLKDDKYYLHKKTFEKSYDAVLKQYNFFYGDMKEFQGAISMNSGEYYLVFVPVNGNGPEKGWGELKSVKVAIP